MKTVTVSLVAAFALSALVVAPSVTAQQPNKSGESPSGGSGGARVDEAMTLCRRLAEGREGDAYR